MYTLNIIKLGKPNKNGLYSVYIRYYCKVNKKPEVYNYPVDEFLTAEQVELIKRNELKGGITNTVKKQEATLRMTITALTGINNRYPTAEELKNFIYQVTHIKPLDYYIQKFFKTLNAKHSSKIQYTSSLNRLVKYVELNKKTIHDITTESFFHAFVLYLKSNHVIKKRNRSNSTLNNIIKLNLRFVNYVAKELNKEPIEYSIELPRKSEKLHLTSEHVKKLLNYDINKETKEIVRSQLKEIQELLRINTVIGLRINELLNVRKDDIIFKPDYVTMKIAEEKTGNTRIIVVNQKEAITAIQYFYNNDNEYPFKISVVSNFNRRLKKLAKNAGLDEEVILNKSVDREYKSTKPKPLHKLISSHAIRRYAIQQNLVKYGTVLTKNYSGHSSFQMIEKYYSRDLNEKEVLALLNK